MSASGKFQHLQREIFALSRGKTWAEALPEWRLAFISFGEIDEQHACLCTHTPIKDLCHLHNRVTGEQAVVGNCCAQRFMGVDSKPVVTAAKRVMADDTRPLNAAVLTLARSRGWISEWEHTFYADTRRKRVLSEKQAAKRQSINKKVLQRLVTNAG